MKIYYDSDADLGLILNKKIGIVGFGNQGHAHALNLKDSGCQVLIGLRKNSPSWAKAEASGLRVLTLEGLAQEAEIISMLIPDHQQRDAYYGSIERWLTPGKVLVFAHGFNIHYHQIIPPPFVDVVMIAPKAPGAMLRKLFNQGLGVPGLVAIHQNASGRAKEIALAYAKGIGCTRAGVLETTFAEETETDLFGEQVVLCGGVSALIKAGFETLIQAGYQPEVAYFECLHELKLIVDLIYEGGLSNMWKSVSDTAEYGGYTRRSRIIDEKVKEEMKRILGEIKNGSFAQEWVLENQAGRPKFNTLRRIEQAHPIEEVGRRLRMMMPWLKG